VLAIVAPGQGSQKPGLLSAWLELDGVADEVALASAATELDLVALGTVADAATITDTAVAQPLLVTTGLVAGRQLLADGLVPDLFAGHSMGELTVAGLAGIVDDEPVVSAAAHRGRIMAQAAAQAETGMMAVVGGEADAVVAAIEAAGTEVSTRNGPGQIVAGGLKERLAELPDLLPAGSKGKSLAVAGAFHTSFMRSVIPDWAVRIDQLTAAEPSAIVLSNLDGAAVTSGADLLARMVLQITHCVYWDRCLETMAELGVTGILELPPAGTLTGLARRYLPGAERFNLNTPDQLDEAREFCRQHSSGAPGR
jgi:[acyl-carrier-protein] S-malonyltransferase